MHFSLGTDSRTSRQSPFGARALWFFAGAAIVSGGLCGQHVTIAVGPGTPNYGRPVYDAITQLQRLTTIPINYEDLQYNYVGDLKDIGSTTKVLVPKGRSFSVNVPVDPATGKLSNALSVSNALNIVIAAAQAAGVVPGAFRVDSSQPGIFFVEPANVHDANGATAVAQPVLDAPVTISFQQTDARQVLDAIFQQVQQKTGARFMPGLFVVGMPSKVSITASAEPAKYVLAKLLGFMYHVPPGMPPPAYLALIEPQFRYYVLNLRFASTGPP